MGAQQLDQAQILNAAMEKKAKQFDRIVAEWKAKVDGLVMDLDVALMETRNISSDLFKVKSAYDESILQLEEVRRENKMLSNEIKDIMDQISEGGRSIHEIDKIRKRLEAEKMELEAALSEAEGALEQEENKVLRASLELTQVRQEIERRIAQKEDEFAATMKNFAKAIEGMQMALESETKGKVEALRMKKKLDTDVIDLGVALEHANAVLTPAEVALHPRTHHQDSPPPPSCPRKPTSSTPSPTPPSSSSRRPLALWMLTRMVSFPLLTWFPPLPPTARTLAVVRPRPCLMRSMGP